MKIDADYRSEIDAAGLHVTLRLLASSDREELARSFEKLSAASRYLRFHALGVRPTADVIDALMDVDAVDRLAIVAVVDSHDLKTERGVGIARFARLSGEPSVAEAAVTVIDEAQGRGIGRALLAALAEAARERGIATFRGSVLARNAPMKRLLEEAGAVVRAEDADTLVFDVPLDQASPGALDRLYALLRAFASLLAELRRATTQR